MRVRSWIRISSILLAPVPAIYFSVAWARAQDKGTAGLPQAHYAGGGERGPEMEVRARKN